MYVLTERPDPLVLNITKTEKRSVTLQWEVTFDGNNEINNVTLIYFVQNNKHETAITRSLQLNESHYTVSDLTPGKVYVFEITTTNKIGTSEIRNKSASTQEDGKSLFHMVLTADMLYSIKLKKVVKNALSHFAVQLVCFILCATTER